MIILAIETSCDDTGVALLDIGGGRMKILSDFVSSQTAIHAPYGGVVPNLAVRAHYKNLPILLEATLKKVDPGKIDLVAATVGPGLEPCLWAGVRTARMLATAMQKPIVGVNHLEGHIAANFISGNPKFEIRNSKSIFPAICLIVSGGHTQLVLIRSMGKYKVIGQTRDDAAGEAFDKVAKLLGLGYPGGPKIALNAQNGTSDAFKLPRPMIGGLDSDFSFSGLKTAVLYLVKNLSSNSNQLGERTVADICASFQQAVVDVLVSKAMGAAKKYKAKTILLSGGVAANRELRKQMGQAIKKQMPQNSKYSMPNIKHCTDNAVMIGLAGYWKYARGGGDKIEKIVAKANLNL